ncbi:ER membrane glycoprotein subunit of the GPI transamidase complex-like protein [Malassezia brasiliensis]|uniref:GPI mannosyltransferase 2 n=1 Tax=Malassezia brasiliensis TaxID=1821822 RepID=A0AAF0DVW4_9BASI|nr:ER membrane glycoprotein subunit of the GPI transamidase complex-like protein [Malassezia brasiliensis]
MTIPRRLLGASLAWRVVCVSLLLVAAHAQQAFDTSGELVQYTFGQPVDEAVWNTWAVPFVRWDTVYFVAAAAHGYTYEQMLAFQPGIVAVLRAAGYLGTPEAWSPTRAVMVGTLAANAASTLAPLLLFWVVRRWTTERVAEIAAMLSIVAPASTSALTAPTPEPFFAMFSLLGFLALGSAPYAYARRTLAAALFAIATCFRANGVLLAGYLVWDAAWASRPPNARVWACRVVGALPLVALTVLPWALFQAWAYARLCMSGTISPWCTSRVPLAYSYVQSTYWDVGLFRYWTVAQVPNFALAAPVLVAGAVGVWAYVVRVGPGALAQAVFMPWRRTSAAGLPLLPYALHTAALLGLLLFASHVQIALRLCTPGGMPFVWYTAAAVCPPRAALRYLCLYGAVAGVLYAGFYPPA